MRTSGVSAVLAVPARAALGARCLHASLLLGLVMLSLHLGLLLALGLFLGALLLHLGLLLALLLHLLLALGLLLGALRLLLHRRLLLHCLLAPGWLLWALLHGFLRHGSLAIMRVLRRHQGIVIGRAWPAWSLIGSQGKARPAL